MVELLVINIDNASYKRGSVVIAKPEGHKWGNGECYPMFVIVKVDMELKDVDKYLVPIKENIIPESGEIYGRIIKRRSTILDFNNVALSIIKDAIATGIVSMTKEQLIGIEKSEAII